MLKERILGGLLGVAVGDALGLPVQFNSRKAMEQRPVTNMEGWGVFNLPPGAWSDDTSLTFCLAESLAEKGLDIEDTGQRFLRWYTEGYCTPTGVSFDIGKSTRQAMERIRTGCPAAVAGGTGERDNGNGSLMRILPAALYFHRDRQPDLAAKIWAFSSITHAHPRACSACYLYALLAKELLQSSSAAQAYMKICSMELSPGLDPGERDHFQRLLGGSLHLLPRDEIESDGYVVHTLEAALWSLLNQRNFADTVLEAVNLGDDTDTTAAVAAGLAGLYYGLKGIPLKWQQALIGYDILLRVADLFAEKIKKNFE
ncbi:MAG TPA: ADP-ribosylglycohydrolase family protein [Syntrophomonadaceae bacterium]|nr:ADP-ribosylglycohydrolase family protein [Syntrophomonadaceae bacterium]